MPQSRSRQRVHGSPKPRAFKSAPTALIASAEDRPSYFPLWIQRPDSAYPSFQRAAEYAWPLTSITGLIGKPYFCANAKSRASCAGTPITALSNPHQHVICNPDFDVLAGQRVLDKEARCNALFLGGRRIVKRKTDAFALFEKTL